MRKKKSIGFRKFSSQAFTGWVKLTLLTLGRIDIHENISWISQLDMDRLWADIWRQIKYSNHIYWILPPLNLEFSASLLNPLSVQDGKIATCMERKCIFHLEMSNYRYCCNPEFSASSLNPLSVTPIVVSSCLPEWDRSQPTDLHCKQAKKRHQNKQKSKGKKIKHEKARVGQVSTYWFALRSTNKEKQTN